MIAASLRRARTAFPALLLALAILPSAQAATAKGEFAIKGIGASDCATAVREYSAGSPNAMMYGGWIYGYLTALNQINPDTFDLAPWQDLNTLTNFMVEYCRKNPNTTFSQAVFNMAVALKAKRLTAASAPLRISVNGRAYTMYAETLNRTAAALKAKGFFKANYDPKKPEFSAEMSKALKAFQAKRKLKDSGEPDQATLFELFER